MRNISRPPEPPSLRNNASQWTKELLHEIAECKRQGKRVPERFYNKYRQVDVRKALELMYNKLCCYCEARLGVVDFPHIEHLKPKKPFPEHTFDWNNLHLACTRCNNAKGDKYNQQYPILDPVEDVPISEHLGYELQWIMPRTKRGETTEKHADLNRDDLRETRRKILFDTLKVIDKVNGNLQDPSNGVRRRELKEKCKEEFGSLINYVMERFLRCA